MKCCHGCSGAFACNSLCQKPRRFQPFFFVSGGEIKAPLSLDLLPVPCLQVVGVAPARQTATTAVHKHSLTLFSQNNNSTSCEMSFNFPKETDSNDNQEVMVSLGTGPPPQSSSCGRWRLEAEVVPDCCLSQRGRSPMIILVQRSK